MRRGAGIGAGGGQRADAERAQRLDRQHSHRGGVSSNSRQNGRPCAGTESNAAPPQREPPRPAVKAARARRPTPGASARLPLPSCPSRARSWRSPSRAEAAGMPPAPPRFRDGGAPGSTHAPEVARPDSGDATARSTTCGGARSLAAAYSGPSSPCATVRLPASPRGWVIGVALLRQLLVARGGRRQVAVRPGARRVAPVRWLGDFDDAHGRPELGPPLDQEPRHESRNAYRGPPQHRASRRAYDARDGRLPQQARDAAGVAMRAVPRRCRANPARLRRRPHTRDRAADVVVLPSYAAEERTGSPRRRASASTTTWLTFADARGRHLPRRPDRGCGTLEAGSARALMPDGPPAASCLPSTSPRAARRRAPRAARPRPAPCLHRHAGALPERPSSPRRTLHHDPRGAGARQGRPPHARGGTVMQHATCLARPRLTRPRPARSPEELGLPGVCGRRCRGPPARPRGGPAAARPVRRGERPAPIVGRASSRQAQRAGRDGRAAPRRGAARPERKRRGGPRDGGAAVAWTDDAAVRAAPVQALRPERGLMAASCSTARRLRWWRR